MSPGAAAVEAFRAAWGEEPTAVVAAPGRLNLIGEHTDYSLLPVLPMAIDRQVAVAAGPGTGSLVEGVSAGHDRTAFAVGSDPMSVQGWGRYVAAAATEAPSQGYRLAVASDLPATGGLSSSSALTVATIRALHRCVGVDLSDLVAAAVRAERRVGVEGGAMDQTVAVHASRGHGLRIDFAPAGLRHVPIPDELAFVAASSGDLAPKGTAVRDAYNERVVAARAGAGLLAWALGVDSSAVPSLRDVSEHADVEAATADLPDEVTARLAADLTGVDLDRIVRLTVGSFDADRPLHVAAVCGHVLSEAARVDAFEQALVAADLVAIGHLLDESHRSLRRFGVSTANLDRLTAAMRDAGALGARLTGAGFGGYALAAASRRSIEAVIRAAERSAGGPAFEAASAEGTG